MKTIEEKAKEYVKPYEHFLLGEETKLMQEAYIAGAKYALANQWKETKKERPKYNQRVLIKTDKGIEIAAWDEHYQRWYNVESGIVTHMKDDVYLWMPIPDLPKTKSNEKVCRM